RRVVPFTDENLQKQKMAEAPEAGQVLDCCNGKTGAWPMLEATARMDLGFVQGSITAQRNKDRGAETTACHQATIRMLPMAYRAPTAQALLQAVEERLLALPQDHRVSAQTEYRASARGTWQLHRQLQRSGMPSLRNIWSRWRTFAQFMRASTMLRRQSRDLKKQFLEDQMRQAELAARKGNHRDLFLIARRLGPKTAQNVSRLQGPDGQVLDSKAEMAAIIKHSSEAFASTPDTTSLQPLEGAFTFTATDLQAELATSGPCFEHHFRPKSTDVLEGDMQACIPPSITYSLEATGCTCKGLQRIKVVATRLIHSAIKHAEAMRNPVTEAQAVTATARAYEGGGTLQTCHPVTSQLGDLETEIFAHCTPSGAAETSAEQGNKRARPDI
ncbi:unnamed protein product, partial [Symbiodinium microadriaticum]